MLNERKAKTAVLMRRVMVEVGRVPGSTLVGDVKGIEGEDSGSNPPSGGGGWQSTGSTLVVDVKGKEGKDSGSTRPSGVNGKEGISLNPPSAGGGWQSTGFDSC